MGQARSAARALAPGSQPAELLAALDQFICSTVKDPLATAAAVVVDPARRTMRYCMAGHPPPLLRGPDGSVTTLGEAGGVLLGLEYRDRPEGVVTFAPGSALVLFTDGLVERRGDASVESGICRLAGDLAGDLPGDPGVLCDNLLRGSLPRHGREDDTAILSAFLDLFFVLAREAACRPTPGLAPARDHPPSENRSAIRLRPARRRSPSHGKR
jgi:hypothetical protein